MKSVNALANAPAKAAADNPVRFSNEEKERLRKKKRKSGGSMSMKQALDKGLNKIISRKLLSWITASTFLCLGFINNEQWKAITIGYVGIQGFADLAATWKHGK